MLLQTDINTFPWEKPSRLVMGRCMGTAHCTYMPDVDLSWTEHVVEGFWPIPKEED